MVSPSGGGDRSSALRERSPMNNPMGEEQDLERQLGWHRRGLRGWNIFQAGGSIYFSIEALLNFCKNYVPGSSRRRPRWGLSSSTDYDETSDIGLSLLESQESE